MIITYTVEQDENGKDVKYILKHRMEISNRLMQKLKYQNKIKLNQKPVFVNAIVSAGDVLEVDIDYDDEVEDLVPQDIPIDIIYEDDCLIAVNKDSNIVVHPTCLHLDGTLANAVAHHMMKKGMAKKIRPVIRLDRNTSGIIIFAKNSYTQESLIRQMNKRIFQKEYIGIVHGRVENPKGTIDLPIERKEGSIMIRHVSPSGDKSVTHFETLEILKNASLLKFRLETGRTHQIRVHCQAIGHPLLGDTMYPYLDISQRPNISNRIENDRVIYELGNTISDNSFPIAQTTHTSLPVDIIERQALHSFRVEFIHPITKKTLQLVAPIPKDIDKALEILRK
ncbi:RluA family pseudouridine synthase [Acetivibrio clariflavus]|uniref:Pseudouridine synthase n=1 Tax=Acetivibrio clariflavus (strain DSM 19732 / NBRC 101661 / EBR45) TaxID=720554 RepID=G8LW16_ACECE|nr:RluA family pseudouridine synthase [Acetivibrio clariflavus]AEV68620.1 pseudouridine synthase, RluA family [Acetivibrio clariflavus DSM 19732]